MIGDLGDGSVLIRRLDSSFWIIEYVGQCSYLEQRSAEVANFGTAGAELVVQAPSSQERCHIVSSDSRLERAVVSPVGGFGSGQAVLARQNGEQWAVSYGSGCTSLEVGEVVTGYIHSPAQFASDGSVIIVVDPYDQRCRIGRADVSGLIATATPTPPKAPAGAPTTEVITVIGELGGGAVLIRRLDGSFWVIEYVGHCSYLEQRSAEVANFGTAGAELVVQAPSLT